jgi:hypothetical protein
LLRLKQYTAKQLQSKGKESLEAAMADVRCKLGLRTDDSGMDDVITSGTKHLHTYKETHV